MLHLHRVVVDGGVPANHLLVGRFAQLETREGIHAHEGEEGGGGARAPEMLLVVDEVGAQEDGQGLQVDGLGVCTACGETGGLRHYLLV